MKRLLLLLVTMTACIAAWAAEGYAVYTASNTTLTFYYGTKPAGAYSLNTGYSYPEWYNAGTYAAVTRVIFDPSFAQARPTSTHYWFCKMENLTSITGLNYLNTSDVTVMSNMFCDCSKLSNIDLSSFNTSKVTTMYHMFLDCKSLTSLDLRSFNTSKLTDMTMMFYHCDALTSIDLSSFNTSEVTSMYAMFSECSSLTSLNLSSFNTLKVTNMRSMFSGCSKLNSLNLSSFNTSNVKDLNGMFYNCSSLNQLNLNNFNTSNVTDMGQMFAGCSNLMSLNLSSFNTSKTTSLFGMFSGCKQLTSLNLTSFNTSNVEKMDWMLYGCKNLKTVIVGSTWSTAAVTMSDGMFYNCTSIVGGAGTTYSSSHTNAAYAHIDEGPSNPGYFSGELEEFDLWINGVQVTNANKNGVTGTGISGSVTYEPSNNTLTLNNATIDQRNISACAISTVYGAPANLKIKLVGENKILANANTIALNVKESQGFTIFGSGSLNCSGALYLDARSTMVNYNTMSYIRDCTVYIRDILSDDYEEDLTINNANVTTEYLYVGGDYNGNVGLTLIGCKVVYPEGGYPHDGCIFVGGQVWSGHVEIKRSAIPGDVNGDGHVNSGDITALYDYLLNGDTSNLVNGDVDNDGHITSGDVTAVYSIMLGS